MPRWQGDGRDRLEQAALELFLEMGYDATTVADITRRAGLTERSFYRHFADKREVLFASHDDVLIGHLTDRLADSLSHQPPYPALLQALSSADTVFLPRDVVKRRVAAIERSQALLERERTKLAAVSHALRTTLCDAGVATEDAQLLVDLGMSVFIAASDKWAKSSASLGDLIASLAGRQAGLLADSEGKKASVSTDRGDHTRAVRGA